MTTKPALCSVALLTAFSSCFRVVFCAQSHLGTRRAVPVPTSGLSTFNQQAANESAKLNCTNAYRYTTRFGNVQAPSFKYSIFNRLPRCPKSPLKRCCIVGSQQTVEGNAQYHPKYPGHVKSSCPAIPTVRPLPPHSPSLIPPFDNLEPWAAENMLTSVGTGSTTSAALNADIETLTTAINSLGDVPLRVAFESVVGILGLVRVRALLRFLPCTPLNGTFRTSW